MGVNWKAFTDQIGHYESFVLVSHIRPDCDALGSELGMAEVLRSIGKKVRIINAHRTPPALQFLDPAGNIEVLGDNVEASGILDGKWCPQPQQQLLYATVHASGEILVHQIQDVSIEEALKSLSQESGIDIAFSSNFIKQKHPLSIPEH